MENLYRAAGEAEGVDRIIEAFYRRVETDEHLRPIYPADLEPGKARLKLFFGQWLGGEAEYSRRYGHPRLRIRHFPFVIDELAAGRWLRHMREAMVECAVPQAELEVIFERLGPLARHMVNAGQDVPREPLPEGTFLQ